MREARGSRPALNVLERQAVLIDAQEVLARADLRHRGWQIIGERVGAVLKSLTAVAGLLILVAAGAFVWSAARADGIVVEAFSVPAEMQASGFTGAVVAAQLLDKINAIEAGTQSARAPSSYANNWGEDSNVEVPYAGVSLGELRRELREWLGSEMRLSGEVVRLDGGRMAITFRTGPRASGRVEGLQSEFDQLLEQAALSVFRATQPYRYTVWLSRNRPDSPERREILTQLTQSPDIKERLWGFHGLALDAAADTESVAIYQRALRIRPDFLPAIGNLPFYALRAGREQDAALLSDRSAAAYREGQSDYNPAHARGYGIEARAQAAELRGDLFRAAGLYDSALEIEAAATNSARRPFTAAAAWARVHDFSAARATLDAAGYLDPLRRAALAGELGPQPGLELFWATAVNDPVAEAAALEAYIAAVSPLAEGPNVSPSDRRTYGFVLTDARIRLSEALARSGRTDEAWHVSANLPVDHDAAIRARGLIAAHAGRAAESDAHFARAVARAPLLPLAHGAWAEALLLRGDVERAIAQAGLAHQKGPRWAEPLRTWGDALMRQGQYQEAVGRYAAAAERAPRWGALHLAWARALWRIGQQEQAREKLRAAAGMDLSRRDRTLLQRMWAAAARG